MSHNPHLESLHDGRHLCLVSRGGWEFCQRKLDRPSVGIVAITDERRVVLVEQYRPPVERNVIELPAGLVGDNAGREQEELLEGAQRELLEETGYRAERWTKLGEGYSSPGLTDESTVLFLAEDLHKQDSGGGVGCEQIKVHEVPLARVRDWLREQEAVADLKLFAGLYVAERMLGNERATKGW